MKHILLSAALVFSLASCAVLIPAPLPVGASEQEVIARLGQPTHRYADGDQRLLEYMTGPFGQTTYMARLDANGRLISYEQVLTVQQFAKIEVDHANKGDVLRLIGAPSDTSYLRLTKLEVWSYPYREQSVWDSMMHVHFDDAGIVRMLQNGPDPRRLPSDGGKM